MKSNYFFWILFFFLFITNSFAQNKSQPIEKAQMRYVDSFEAGQPNAAIFKLYDASDDVICYILMPENATKKQVDGKFVYEANTVGSLSCLKANSTKSPSEKK
jgi:hypothetical protein